MADFDFTFASRLAEEGVLFTLHKKNLSGALGHGAKVEGLSFEDMKAKHGLSGLATVGAKGGSHLKSGNYLVVIDADAPGLYAALEAEDSRLAKALSCIGTKLGHLYIQTEIPIKKQALDLPDKGGRAIDILGVGSMAVIPPSISQKSGKPYKVVREGAIEFIPSTELFEILTRIQDKHSLTWAQGAEPDGKKKSPPKESSQTASPEVEAIRAKLTLFDLGLQAGLQSCPLSGHAHGDKNKSLSVKEDGSVYHCFATHGGGDIFTYYALQNNLDVKKDFMRIKGDLAKKAGIALTEVRQGGKIYGEYTLAKVGGQLAVKTVVHDKTGIYIQTSSREGGARTDRILHGNIHFNTRLNFRNITCAPIWEYTLNEEQHSGTMKELSEVCQERGLVTGGLEMFRQAISAILSGSTIPTREVYAAAGIYYDKTTEKLVVAAEGNTCPRTASQIPFLENHILPPPGKYTDEEVVRASANFIESMPQVGKIPAFITRGFSCIAPLGYEIKKSPLALFPYLYLFGDKGSSKTQMANCSITAMWGERTMLTSNSVDSGFRLGVEFGAATYPAVIDDAHESFIDNLEIFKAAATGGLATKRGTKNLEMKDYDAFRTFVFTSNEPPIMPEDDPSGAVADRVLTIECKNGFDFNSKLNFEAMRIIGVEGRLLGQIITNTLANNVKMDELIEKIRTTSDSIMRIYAVPQRRAYCLGCMIEGCRIYQTILGKYGIKQPFAWADDDAMIRELCSNVIQQSKENEKSFSKMFMEWAEAITSQRRIMGDGTSVPDYTLHEREGVYLATNGELLITRRALFAYKKMLQTRNMPISTLAGLMAELAKDGVMTVAPQSNRTINEKVIHTLRVLARQTGQTSIDVKEDT